MQRVVDHEQLELIATGLCLLSRNLRIKQPTITVADNADRLIMEFEDGFISIEVWEDNERYFFVAPGGAAQTISQKAFAKSTVH